MSGNNTQITLLFGAGVTLMLAVVLLIAKMNQGWGDWGLLVFLLLMNTTVAVLSYRAASAVENKQELLAVVTVALVPYLLACSMLVIYQWVSMMLVVGLAAGVALCLASITLGLMSRDPYMATKASKLF